MIALTRLADHTRGIVGVLVGFVLLIPTESESFELADLLGTESADHVPLPDVHDPRRELLVLGPTLGHMGVTVTLLEDLKLAQHLFPDEFAALFASPQEPELLEFANAFGLHLAHPLALSHVAHPSSQFGILGPTLGHLAMPEALTKLLELLESFGPRLSNASLLDLARHLLLLADGGVVVVLTRRTRRRTIRRVAVRMSACRFTSRR